MPGQCGLFLSEPAGQEQLTSHRSQTRREKMQTGICQASLTTNPKIGRPNEGWDDAREILAFPRKL